MQTWADCPVEKGKDFTPRAWGEDDKDEKENQWGLVLAQALKDTHLNSYALSAYIQNKIGLYVSADRIKMWRKAKKMKNCHKSARRVYLEVFNLPPELLPEPSEKKNSTLEQNARLYYFRMLYCQDKSKKPEWYKFGRAVAISALAPIDKKLLNKNKNMFTVSSFVDTRKSLCVNEQKEAPVAANLAGSATEAVSIAG
jgi:hypothetical protein